MGPDGVHLGIYPPVLHELLLRAANARVRLGVEVAAIEQNESGARVRFSDGSEDEFDIVVAPTECIPRSARSRSQRRRLPTAAICAKALSPRNKAMQ
jgi:hypothetical protein